jgi:hypothetical protein
MSERPAMGVSAIDSGQAWVSSAGQGDGGATGAVVVTLTGRRGRRLVSGLET